jgi:putative addiction module component (TIGR02574 family)
MTMNTRIQAIAEEAERLPASARVRLVEILLTSLDKPDPEIDRAWAEECERRIDSYLRGETTALDAEEVLAKYLKP